MDQYGIKIETANGGASRFRTGRDADTVSRWEISEAEEIANRLLERPCVYVTIGNGEHEFRRWGSLVDGQDSWFEFRGPDLRWSDWYVDAEINGRRWRYRPVADLRNWEDADALAEEVAELHPHVTRIWIGTSDGSEEFEHETRAG